MGFGGAAGGGAPSVSVGAAASGDASAPSASPRLGPLGAPGLGAPPPPSPRRQPSDAAAELLREAGKTDLDGFELLL